MGVCIPMPYEIVKDKWLQESYGEWTIQRNEDQLNSKIAFNASATREQGLGELLNVLQTLHRTSFTKFPSEVRIEMKLGPQNICQFVTGFIR